MIPQGDFKNGRFQCELLLAGEAVGGFGSESFCTWTTSQTLVATFSNDASVQNLAIAAVRNNKLKSSFPNTTLYLQNATFVLSAPASAVGPAVIISAPATIGRCDELALDGTLTSGSGGRIMDAEWTVVFTGDSSNKAAAAANMTAILRNASESDILAVKFAPEDVPFGTFTFSLRCANWLGNTDRLSVNVTKVNADPPMVRIGGFGASTTIYASDTIKLTAVATLPGCSGGSRSVLKYNWTETTGLLRLQWAKKLTPVQAAAVSAGLSSRQLILRAGYLTAPFSYLLRVVVTEFVDGDRMLSNAAEIRVNVRRSLLFAAIDGGSQRKQSALSPLLLDGVRRSYDPDNNANDRSQNTPLSFRWKCFMPSPSAGEFTLPCTNASNSILDMGTYWVDVNEYGNDGSMSSSMAQEWSAAGVAEIPAYTLSAGTYLFVLTIRVDSTGASNSTAAANDVRNATASCYVNLVSDLVPVVAVEALALAKINPTTGTYLQLAGRDDSDQQTARLSYGDVRYEWTKVIGDKAQEPFTSLFVANAQGVIDVSQLKVGGVTPEL